MWSWVLALCGIAGTFLIGKKTIQGWIVLFINETLWIIYALQTKQYGFIVGSLAYMSVYVKSYRYWNRGENENV